MVKPLQGNTTLSIDNAPVKKIIEKKKEKLGLLTEKKRKLQTFRLRLEVIEALHEITEKINKKSAIKIPMGMVIELIIMDARKKNVNEIIDIIKLNQ
jgi:hypothetical protein